LNKKPQLYRYEVSVPVAQYWVYEVIASSESEALEKYRKCEDCEQKCEDTAPIGSRKIVIRKKGKYERPA